MIQVFCLQNDISSIPIDFKMKSQSNDLIIANSGKVDSSKTYSTTNNIDSMDSVIFNFSTATISSIYVDFPISFRSDDSIYALDFSFQYNTSNVEFDTLFNLTTGLQYLYHYNVNDSTFRFTSNKLTPISNDSAVIVLRFKTFTGQMCANDIYSTSTYLNGEISSHQLFGCIVSEVYEINEKDISTSVFPNPSVTEFSYRFMHSKSFDEIRMFNSKGELVKIEITDIYQPINIQSLAPGLYIVEFLNKSSGYKKHEKFVKADYKN